MLARIFLWILISTWGVGSSVEATERPRIGLALSGGGVKGFAQIGVLKVFEEIGLPIDYIAGSSMGSIVGGLYAIGYSADELELLVTQTDWDELFSESMNRRTMTTSQKLWNERTFLTLPVRGWQLELPSGLKTGQRISRLLCRLTLPVHHIEDFREFPIPFVCLATDIETGEGVLLERGFLPHALRASMGIPSIFTPTEIDNRRLVDGGEVRTIPVDDVLQFNPDIVIAVDATSRLYRGDQLHSLLTIYDQTMRFHKVSSNLEQLEKTDLVIRPDFKALSVADFSRIGEFIKRGEKAAREMMPLLQVILDSTGTSNDIKRRLPTVSDTFYITEVDIQGNRETSEELVKKELEIQVPAVYQIWDIERVIDRVYSLQLFEQVTYRVMPGTSGTKLIIYVVEKEIDEFRFGLRYDSNDDAAVLLNPLIRNLMIDNALLNLDLKLGRQLRFDAQYLFPVGVFPAFGIRSRVNYFKDLIDIFSGEMREARMELQSFFFESLIGNLFASDITISFGFRAETSVASPNIAPAAIRDSLSFDETVFPLIFQLWIDTLNRTVYPTSGMLAVFRNEIALQDISYERDFSRHLFLLRMIVPANLRISILGEMVLGRMTGNPPPHYGFFLGGIERPMLLPDRTLSTVSFVGLKSQELFANHAQFFQLGVQYALRSGYFLLVRANAGNVFSRWHFDLNPERFESGVGVTLGRNSPIGPLEISLMRSSRHDLLTHFNIGYRF